MSVTDNRKCRFLTALAAGKRILGLVVKTKKVNKAQSSVISETRTADNVPIQKRQSGLYGRLPNGETGSSGTVRSSESSEEEWATQPVRERTDRR